jgi:hypothetical protein
VVGISRSIGGGNYQGQVVGEIIKVKWWGYQGQLVGEIIKVKWWGYLDQVVGISRPSGGDIKVRGRGLEVKVKKKWWGVRALSNSLYSFSLKKCLNAIIKLDINSRLCTLPFHIYSDKLSNLRFVIVVIVDSR